MNENEDVYFEPTEQTEPVTEPTEQTEQVTEPIKETTEPTETKRKRGRPRKEQQQQVVESQTDTISFFNDLADQRNSEAEFGNIDLTDETGNEQQETQAPPMKETLLFLDGIICSGLKTFLKKNIEPMSESEAEFIGNLAPQGFDLLKPSKTTFLVVLSGYYLMKLL